MKTEFTPGPWPLETVPTSCGICHKIGAFPKTEERKSAACLYVDYNAHSKEMLANAYLIAAAPDLYAALENALLVLSGESMSKQSLIDALESSTAAIAKARGEQP